MNSIANTACWTAAIRACEVERGRADLDEITSFKPGARVRMLHPGLRGIEGLVQSVSAKRVTLLFELLGRENSVSVQHHEIELA